MADPSLTQLEKYGFPDPTYLLEGYDDPLHRLGAVAALVPDWWTPFRDAYLRRFYKKSDHLSGAVASVVAKMTSIPLEIYPRNQHIRRHRQLAARYQDNLMNFSGMLVGWHTEYGKWMLDYLTQDNGGFMVMRQALCNSIKTTTITTMQSYKMPVTYGGKISLPSSSMPACAI